MIIAFSQVAFRVSDTKYPEPIRRSKTGSPKSSAKILLQPWRSPRTPQYRLLLFLHETYPKSAQILFRKPHLHISLTHHLLVISLPHFLCLAVILPNLALLKLTCIVGTSNTPSKMLRNLLCPRSLLACRCCLKSLRN